MMMTEMEMMKLQNGSDVRGVAVAGVPGEEVTLTPDCCCVRFLSCQKTRKRTGCLADCRRS